MEEARNDFPCCLDSKWMIHSQNCHCHSHAVGDEGIHSDHDLNDWNWKRKTFDQEVAVDGFKSGCGSIEE